MNRRLSQKIAIMLTVFIFASVLIFSILTINLLKTALLGQKSIDLFGSARLIAEITDKNRNDGEKITRLLRGAGLPFYILFTVYVPEEQTDSGDADKETSKPLILATNDPFIPILKPVKKAERYIEKNYFADGDLNILYTTMQSGNLYIQTAMYMDTDSIDHLLRTLPLILALTSLPLLVLSFFAARFFTARMLRPVQMINRAAKEISAQNLDRRIPENGTGDELEELARTFNDLFTRLQSDFERERRFVSDISHELKTPLAVLLGHLDLLRRWGKNDPAVADKSLETAYGEARSMQGLIENMLLLSRSENAPAAQTAALYLHPLLKRLVDDTKLIHSDVECVIDCPENAVIHSNEEILTQVLRILTDNAVRYSAPPAYIEYEFRSENGRSELTVRDRGNGLAAKDLPHIFERLYRADESRNRKTGGSGLGLAIARSLLLRVHASIGAESPAVQSDGSKRGSEMRIIFGAEE